MHEPSRLCSGCRALHEPQLGSAWCGAVELGDERARICANFAPTLLQNVRPNVAGGRAGLLDMWRAVSGQLRSILGEAGYRTWFEGVEPIELVDDELSLTAPDEYTRDWLEQRLHPVMRSALNMTGHAELAVRYSIEAVAEEQCADETGFVGGALNPHYCFDEFIVGRGNRLAHAGALACVSSPGATYNPLVMYGGVGVGKTHLLQAIAQAVHERGGRSALYVTSETFTNELIGALHAGAMPEFRDRYRSLDYLLIDDVQFIAGKEATQEEFFHTFNALYESGKQVVITTDRPPEQLRSLEQRLRSRFSCGVVADIQPPDLETRLAILRSKATRFGRDLPPSALSALALRVRGNVRELEGALNRILAVADLRELEPDLDLVRELLGDDEDERRCSPADVIQGVISYFQIKGTQLASPERSRNVAYPRQVAMYLLREDIKLSFNEIGAHLGGRNHSTVIHGCDKIEQDMRQRARVRFDVQAIRQLIYGVR
ncbi:MAG: chromosomal replication initiator protein DnaA [Chloroflexota bacterium]